MSHPATVEQTKSQPRRLHTETDEPVVSLTDDHRTSREIRAALDATPADSVTAPTAGALRVAGPRRTIADERAAFEQAVAEENARQSEG